MNRRPATGLRLRCGLIAAALAMMAMTSACTSEPELTREQVEEITAALEKELLAQPEVAIAIVRYQDTFTAPAAADVEISLKPGVEFEPWFGRATELVWRSRLTPVTGITVVVGDGPGGKDMEHRLVNVLNEKGELEKKYGKRSV